MNMIKTGSNNLELERCPHCSVDKPNLNLQWSAQTHSHSGDHPRWWYIYQCNRCGGLITTATSDGRSAFLSEIYPSNIEVDNSVPEKAKKFLNQAINSLHAPDGAIMLAASSIDAMLKAKSYIEGSLNTRINQAATDHLITTEMAQWAHEVRLDANDQRHSDVSAENATEDEARKAIKFTQALAEFMFVLPSKVSRGLKDAKEGENKF